MQGSVQTTGCPFCLENATATTMPEATLLPNHDSNIETYKFLQKGSKSHKTPAGVKAPGAPLWEIQQGRNYAGPHSHFTGLLPASWCHSRSPTPARPVGLCRSGILQQSQGDGFTPLPHRRLPLRRAAPGGHRIPPERLPRRQPRRGWGRRCPALGHTHPLPLQPPAARFALNINNKQSPMLGTGAQSNAGPLQARR